MKKVKILLTAVLVICICLLVGVVYLFNDIFPKAKPIQYPKIGEITSVLLSCSTPDGTIPMSELYYEDLLLYISEASPTRNQSINDYPTNRPYYGIEVQTSERQYRYFVYEEGEQVYIEIPYEGIYASKMELLELVMTYFTEG